MRPTTVLPASTIGGVLWWLPRLAFTLFVAAVVALLWYSEKTDDEERRATLISDMLWLEQNLRFTLTHNEELLSHFDPQRIHDPEVFQAYGRGLIANNSGLRQIIWLDRHGKLRHALPAPTDSVAVGEGQALAALRLASERGVNPADAAARLARLRPHVPLTQGIADADDHGLERNETPANDNGSYSLRNAS